MLYGIVYDLYNAAIKGHKQLNPSSTNVRHICCHIVLNNCSLAEMSCCLWIGWNCLFPRRGVWIFEKKRTWINPTDYSFCSSSWTNPFYLSGCQWIKHENFYFFPEWNHKVTRSTLEKLLIGTRGRSFNLIPAAGISALWFPCKYTRPLCVFFFFHLPRAG